MAKATAVAKPAAPTHSKEQLLRSQRYACLLYTSDAADE